jgi:predicted ester cyclase
MQATVENLVAEGDKVASHWTLRGTHQGDLMGMPPTGKQVTLTVTEIDRFEAGKCVETWADADMLGFLQQLGALPQMAQTGV